jgi:hypothetical protein
LSEAEVPLLYHIQNTAMKKMNTRKEIKIIPVHPAMMSEDVIVSKRSALPGKYCQGSMPGTNFFFNTYFFI